MQEDKNGEDFYEQTYGRKVKKRQSTQLTK